MSFSHGRVSDLSTLQDTFLIPKLLKTKSDLDCAQKDRGTKQMQLGKVTPPLSCFCSKDVPGPIFYPWCRWWPCVTPLIGALLHTLLQLAPQHKGEEEVQEIWVLVKLITFDINNKKQQLFSPSRNIPPTMLIFNFFLVHKIPHLFSKPKALQKESNFFQDFQSS